MASMAQSAIDAMQVTQSDFRGTARFMSMGGAFTALGGDLSTMGQNPAGIGVYRSSEIGVTLDINAQSTKTPMTSSYPYHTTQTKVGCNNFGYVGATNLYGALKSFNWGVSYNRVASFDRRYRGYIPTIGTSLTNYVAAFSNGYPASGLALGDDLDKYNPYFDTDYDWLSILAYNSFMINPTGTSGQGNSYSGLFNQNTAGDALYEVREKGYVDEYNISFGGNVENVVYWGLSIGITDLDYRKYAYYSESLGNAEVPADDGKNVTNGSFVYDLYNNKQITGSGWNLKAGVIIRPINELRIGVAVHTPTWYTFDQRYYADVDYSYVPTDFNGEPTGDQVHNSDYTEEAYFKWKLASPWKFMIGAAGVIGNQAIVSVDYEYAGYNSMSVKTPYSYDAYGNGYDYESDETINDNIKSYFKSTNTVRLGLEYRVTPQFSVRAGYNVSTSNTKKEAYDNYIQVQTTGTDPSYYFNNTTQHISFGLGYKYKQWYIDGAYVYTHKDGRYSAFTSFDGNIAPCQKLVDNNSSIVLSTGFKF